MKRLLILLALAAGTLGVQAQNITGTWSGRADLGIRKMSIVFDIERNGDGYSGTMTSPDQGGTKGPVSSVAFSGDTLRIAIDRINFEFTGVKKGELIEGAITQRGATFPLVLERGEATINRPQTPEPPYPYSSEDVFFENSEAGITLAGTLTTPWEDRGFPTVVLITGSGTQNRDEEMFGHKPFLVIADHFARNGIATLRFDDRGAGQSEGDPTLATSEDFATDAYAAIEYLKTRNDISPEKIGLAGHSEGGLIAFLAAVRHPEDIAFVISMAGPGVSGDSLTLMQIEDIGLQAGTPRRMIDLQLANQRKALDIIRSNSTEYINDNIDSISMQIVPGFKFLDEGTKETVRRQMRASASPWFKYFLTHDPADQIRATQCPVMAINGENDLQVRADVNIWSITAALQEGGNGNFKTAIYPGLNHLFQHTETGRIQEYGELEETFSPEVLEDMAAWILEFVDYRYICGEDDCTCGSWEE